MNHKWLQAEIPEHLGYLYSRHFCKICGVEKRQKTRIPLGDTLYTNVVYVKDGAESFQRPECKKEE